MVDIGGIPRQSNENTDNIVIKVAEKIGVTITQEDIEISHRNSAHKDASIIVKFLSRRTRNSFFEKRKGLKDIKVKDLDIGLDACGSKIFINESLTPYNGDLFKKARTSLKDYCKYIWTHNGSIFTRVAENSTRIILRSHQDLQDLHQSLNLNSKKEIDPCIIQSIDNSQDAEF